MYLQQVRVCMFLSSRLSYLFSFSLSAGDGSIRTEILSQKAVRSTTTDQSNRIPFRLSSSTFARLIEMYFEPKATQINQNAMSDL